MSPEAVVNLFDIGDLYEQYENTTGDEKQELKEKDTRTSKNKMVIQREQENLLSLLELIIQLLHQRINPTNF